MQLRSADLEPIGALWHVSGIEALPHQGQVWLRGRDADDTTNRLLARVPCEARFAVLADGQLLQSGKRVPHGFLPQGVWLPLKKFVTLTLPPASVPARKNVRVPVRLVPSTELSEPNVLITDLTAWSAYVASAPQVRLRNLRFAVSGDGRVLVCGVPLPPIAGTRAVARAGLVVPCGWGWVPAVEATILAQAWGIDRGDLWLMWPGKPLERIAADQFVTADRSAVLQTMEALRDVRT